MEYIDVTETNDTVREPAMLPHSEDAEKSVVGSALISPDAAEIALDKLQADDFYYPAHRDIFAAMRKLSNAGKPIDTITVMDMLEGMGKAGDVGGMSYITALSLYTPSAANVRYYVDIVYEYSVRRKLIRTGDMIISEATDSECATQEALSNAERRIFEIAMNKSENSLVHISGPLMESHSKIGKLIKLKGKMSGITTGFRDMDRLTSGWQRSDLVIIAARPSMGKTAFVLNLATNAAITDNASVAIFSLEMSSEQLIIRMLCSEARVDMQHVKTGQVNDTELMSIATAVPKLERTRIHIDDTAGISPSQIRTKCRRLKAQHGLDIIIIDYLQLMQSDTRTENRVQVVAEMTRSLKMLARELDVTIILLSQLSRGPEKRENHRPMMADLRESGAIEQDADIIAMLYRPAVYEETADNSAEVIFAKHRNGPTDTVKLMWNPEYTRFTNMEFGSE
ncbi:MAG: replicative DNA helicase [Clostridia bacterium]|nr:replicative DNA helicase [Clostridia bacterium]